MRQIALGGLLSEPALEYAVAQLFDVLQRAAGEQKDVADDLLRIAAQVSVAALNGGHDAANVERHIDNIAALFSAATDSQPPPRTVGTAGCQPAQWRRAVRGEMAPEGPCWRCPCWRATMSRPSSVATSEARPPSIGHHI